MDYSLYDYGRPSLVMSSGPDRVVRDEPADEGTRLPARVGFSPPPLPPERHVASGTVCVAELCSARHHRPRHRAEGTHREEPTTYVGRHARLVTP